jgi:branched-chain amino acid aminotransferase
MATETRAVSGGSKTTAESPVVYFNGAFLPQEQATVGVGAHALHYGSGCFEGIRAYWDDTREELNVLKLDEHIDRFFRSCGVLRIYPPFDRAEMHDLVVELLRRNRFRCDVYIRPIAFKSAQNIKLKLDGLEESFAILAFPFGYYAHREGGLLVCLSPWRRIDDNAIPARAKVTGSYVNACLASDDAAQAGYDEALLLNQSGTLSEASSSNVFLVRWNRLITPPASENILEGITRDAVMTLARRELGMEVDERPVGRTEIYVADEVFLCGTGVQVEPVARVDGRPIGSGVPGPVTTRLQALYAAAVHNRLPAYSSWCTPVYDVTDSSLEA